MSNAEMRRHEGILRADIIIKSAVGKGTEGGGIRGGRGFAVAEEGCDDYEVFRRVEGFCWADEPFVVGDGWGDRRGLELFFILPMMICTG